MGFLRISWCFLLFSEVWVRIPRDVFGFSRVFLGFSRDF